MPGFPLNSLRSFVQAGILSVNVFTVKVYCLLYAFVAPAAKRGAGERLSNKINVSTGWAGLLFLIFMEMLPPVRCGRAPEERAGYDSISLGRKTAAIRFQSPTYRACLAS